VLDNIINKYLFHISDTPKNTLFPKFGDIEFILDLHLSLQTHECKETGPVTESTRLPYAHFGTGRIESSLGPCGHPKISPCTSVCQSLLASSSRSMFSSESPTSASTSSDSDYQSADFELLFHLFVGVLHVALLYSAAQIYGSFQAGRRCRI
jgi:hypothetical protein